MDTEKLYRYFGGSATDAERREIRQWVDSSDDNRSEFMAQRKFYDMAMMLDAERTAGDVDAGARLRPRVSRMQAWAGRAVAAVVATILTVGVMSLFTRNSPVELPMQQISVPAGQRLNLVLADGTSVWLNSGTTMRYPGAFTGDERRVTVDGEAYFTVAKDADKPFKVDTKRGQVLVTGTTFNVDAYGCSPDFAVSLIEGSVSFSSGRRVYRMLPGTRIVSDDSGNLNVDRMHNEDLEWINGIVSFNELPLRDIIAKFEKYYGVTVDFKRDDIAGVRFSGKFYLDEGVEQALNTLRHDIKFDFTSDKDHRHIVIK